MKRVAVIGLGIMGHGIASNFLSNGYEVIVWNRTAAKADDLVAQGARLAASVRDAVEHADIVIEVTANDESSREMWLGDDGIVAHARPDQYLIVCATVSPQWTDELAAVCTDKGLTFFDMPMTGGRSGAETGQLILLVGGDRAKLHEVEPDLQAIAKDVKYFGKAGSGMRYKLILNAIQAMHIAALGEALRMANAVGLDEKVVGDALAERPGGVITNLTWQGYQDEPNPINFSVEWIAKDLGYAAEMSESIKHPLLDEVRAQYEQAKADGFSHADWTKITKL